MASRTRQQQRASRPEWDLREMLGGGGKNVRHRGSALPRATDWRQPWTGGREPGAGYADAVVFRGKTACVRLCIPWAECPPQPAGVFSAPLPTVRSRCHLAARHRVLAHPHPTLHPRQTDPAPLPLAPLFSAWSPCSGPSPGRQPPPQSLWPLTMASSSSSKPACPFRHGWNSPHRGQAPGSLLMPL